MTLALGGVSELQRRKKGYVPKQWTQQRRRNAVGVGKKGKVCNGRKEKRGETPPPRTKEQLKSNPVEERAVPPLPSRGEGGTFREKKKGERRGKVQFTEPQGSYRDQRGEKGNERNSWKGKSPSSLLHQQRKEASPRGKGKKGRLLERYKRRPEAHPRPSARKLPPGSFLKGKEKKRLLTPLQKARLTSSRSLTTRKRNANHPHKEAFLPFILGGGRTEWEGRWLPSEHKRETSFPLENS